MPTTTIPLDIAPEAVAYVADRNLDEPFRQILDRLQQTVEGIKSIKVTLEEPFQGDENEHVVFEVMTGVPPQGYDTTESKFDRWVIETFSPHVYLHFLMFIIPE